LHNKKEIENYGIKEFNQECKNSVFEQISEWQDLTERIGYWLDFENAYITYNPQYMESVWFILKQAWEKNCYFKIIKLFLIAHAVAPLYLATKLRKDIKS